jgi:hypothetical protein
MLWTLFTLEVGGGMINFPETGKRKRKEEKNSTLLFGSCFLYWSRWKGERGMMDEYK